MRLIKHAPLLLALALGAAAPAAAAEGAPGDHAGWFARLCAQGGDDSRRAEWAEHRGDRLAEKLKLTDAQKAAFKDLTDTRAKLRADRKAALCANKPDLSTLENRLAFGQAQLEARLADMKAEAPKLLGFYNSLDDKQKASFDEMRAHWGHHGWSQGGHHHRHHRHHHDGQN
jgi:Spy/CpxP family protein refolding chaperone